MGTDRPRSDACGPRALCACRVAAAWRGASGVPGRYPAAMSEAENWLLVTRLRRAAERLAGTLAEGEAAALWQEAERSVEEAGCGEDAAVALPVLERSLPELEAWLAAVDARRAPLPAWDQAVLKRAMNAYKKRLKVTRGDDEVTSSRSPTTRGASSSILGVRPPEHYTDDIWTLLVAHGRLRDAELG